ncbi:hypothetical protein L6452_35269 [Arctium lappa]|uniref:Uncharacterized protein n=1 Tax=Arctium lappa TaxID=4217 RepID=A0ACB8YA61_ARCLA|nr:hypothetical protein L6452_35269 [Arctium lappa]
MMVSIRVFLLAELGNVLSFDSTLKQPLLQFLIMGINLSIDLYISNVGFRFSFVGFVKWVRILEWSSECLLEGKIQDPKSRKVRWLQLAILV